MADRLFVGTRRGLAVLELQGGGFEEIRRAFPDASIAAVCADAERGLVFAGTTEGVFRSGDGGDTWSSVSNGLPERHAYMGVLRGAMASDDLDPCGVYVGTTAGTVYTTNDAGDSWRQLPCTLPRIMSMAVYVDV